MIVLMIVLTIVLMIVLTIVLTIVLKKWRNYHLKELTHAPPPQTPTPSVPSESRCATFGGGVAVNDDCLDFAPLNHKLKRYS